MAQKVVGLIKLQIPAGKATPAPPVGPALGQHGVNIVAFTKDFNERTKNDAGCGLIKYGSALVPFINRFPQNTKLYQLMTTRPGEGKFARGRD